MATTKEILDEVGKERERQQTMLVANEIGWLTWIEATLATVADMVSRYRNHRCDLRITMLKMAALAVAGIEDYDKGGTGPRKDGN